MQFSIWIYIALVFNFVIIISAESWKSDKVDLSNKNIQNKEFFETHQHDIEVNTMRELNLSGNSLNSFLDCATNLNNLEVLDLSRNRLDRFYFLCRNESYELRFLNVSHNKLKYIDENAFNHRTGKLKVLDISWNLLSGINDTVLQHMKVLEFVSFANNPIGDNIEELAFENLTTLTHLDLKNISAANISPTLFENLINLEYLDLSLNPIEEIPLLPYDKLEVLDLSQTNLMKLGNLELPHLRELRLNNMPNLTIVLLNNLEKLPNLEVLSVKECKRLTQLRIRPQNPNLLPHLRVLYIQSCAIQTLSSELQSIIQRTAVFEFQNNPWHCDCRMKWITIVNTTHNLTNTTKCNSPASVHNKAFSEIPPTELQCEVEGYSFSPIIWICVASISLSLVAVGSILMFKEPLTHWIIRRRRISGDSVSYTNVIESSNDLVKILTDTDVQDRFEECIKT